MIRVRNWDLELLRWRRSILGEPFAWGETDCGSLVRGATRTLYGRDPFQGVRTYTSRFGALRAHVETGGIEDAVRAAGGEEVGLGFARQGDVLVEPPTEERPMGGAGVVVAGEVVVCPEGEAVTTTPMRALRAREPDVRALRLP